MDQSQGRSLSVATPAADGSSEFLHLAAVRDGQARRIYLDGKLSSAAVTVNENKLQGRSPGGFFLGFSGGGTHMAGAIDEVRISKIARYSADFLPQRRFDSDASTLALYHFDEGQGDVLNDSSGNNHHGKIIGAKWTAAGEARP